MKIYDLDTPHIGCGRWAIPKFLLEDKIFLDKVTELGRETQESMNLNPQERLTSFIHRTRTLAKQMSKIKLGKMNSAIKKLTETKQKILQKTNLYKKPHQG